jgi:hypothetical protein
MKGQGVFMTSGTYDDTKEVIRIRKANDIQYSGQKGIKFTH